jgi:hypothetical protein
MMTRTLLVLAVASTFVAGANAAVTADEAKQLGTTLTPVGAEKAGNKDGTIPEWTGVLANPPAVAKGSGIRPDPFAADKPRLTITGKDVAAHADKLTAGAQELLKRYPTMRIDVYPTRRPFTFPKRVLDNVAKNATGAKAIEGGLGVEGALPGYPFPIPKTGNEVMWNHILRFPGHVALYKYENWNVDSAGVATLALTSEGVQEYPIFDPKRTTEVMQQSDVYVRLKLNYLAPARRSGEALMVFDSVNPLATPRRAWQYLPGQRRVKLAPDIAYDTPNPGTAGLATYDDAFVFNGAQDRFNFKLIGKREMYIPYNNYRLVYGKNPADALKPNHVNPDLVRWELHRVWVVEATLKPDKRHIYAKRIFYFDEDSWVAVVADNFDARGQLFTSVFSNLTYSYDVEATDAASSIVYNFVVGAYNANTLTGQYFGTKPIDPLPAAQWAAEALAGAGVR